jgi:hypothetical protein
MAGRARLTYLTRIIPEKSSQRLAFNGQARLMTGAIKSTSGSPNDAGAEAYTTIFFMVLEKPWGYEKPISEFSSYTRLGGEKEGRGEASPDTPFTLCKNC